MGIFSRGIKKGVILGFLISFIMFMVELIVLYPGAFTDLDMVMAIIIMILPWVALSTGLGAVGGLISEFVFRRKTVPKHSIQ